MIVDKIHYIAIKKEINSKATHYSEAILALANEKGEPTGAMRPR